MSVYRIVENGKTSGEVGAEFHLYDLLVDEVVIEKDTNYPRAFKEVEIKIKPGDTYQESVGNNDPYAEQTYDKFIASVEANSKFDRGE